MPTVHGPLILSGIELIAILRVTTKSVKMLTADGRVLGHIQPENAILVVRAGSYVGKCSRTRVHYIRQVKDARKVAPDYEYRIGRPMIQPYPVKDLKPWDRWASRKNSRLEYAAHTQGNP